MIYAKCHRRKHYAKGLCNPCYQRSRCDHSKKRESAKAYHGSHIDEIHERQRNYYRLNNESLRAKRRARYVPRPRLFKAIKKLITRSVRPRAKKVVTFERPPAPAVLAVSDKDWWKLDEKDKPRSWL